MPVLNLGQMENIKENMTININEYNIANENRTIEQPTDSLTSYFLDNAFTNRYIFRFLH